MTFSMSRRRGKILVALGIWLLLGCLWIAYSDYSSKSHHVLLDREDTDHQLQENEDFDQFRNFKFNVKPHINQHDAGIDAIVRRNRENDRKKREELLGMGKYEAERKQENLQKLPGDNFAKDRSNFQLGEKAVTYPVKSPNATQLVLFDPQEMWLQANSPDAGNNSRPAGHKNEQDGAVSEDQAAAGNGTKTADAMHSKMQKKSRKSSKHSRTSLQVQNPPDSQNRSVRTSQNKLQNTNRTSSLVEEKRKSSKKPRHQNRTQNDPASSFAQGAMGRGQGRENYPTKSSAEKLPGAEASVIQEDPVVQEEEDSGVKIQMHTSTPSNNSHDNGNRVYPTKPASVLATDSSNATSQPAFNSSHHGKYVVSMTLYGDALRYTMGAYRNAELIQRNFPGWTLRIYTEMPSDKPKFGLVPQNMITMLRSQGADIQYVVTEYDPIPPMMWRFLVADDPAVERFIIRDADARLTERDATAVQAWIESGEAFNCIRDHPSHAGYSISGGLWGGWVPKLKRLMRHTWREMMLWQRKSYLEDMNFLNKRIWPLVERHAYCSDSVSCDVWPGAHPFPVQRYGYEHVGQVMDQHDLGRPQDVTILRHAGENPKCVPQTGRILGRTRN